MGWACELDDGNVLTESQMAAGYILPCSAIPLTDCTVEYSCERTRALPTTCPGPVSATTHAPARPRRCRCQPANARTHTPSKNDRRVGREDPGGVEQP